MFIQVGPANFANIKDVESFDVSFRFYSKTDGILEFKLYHGGKLASTYIPLKYKQQQH